MKYIYLVATVLLISCDNGDSKADNEGCVLAKLPKTVDYLNNIKKISALKADTFVVLEKETINGKIYTTVLDINENEVSAWMEINNAGKKDTILIHSEDYVEYLNSISTKFDNEKCELIRTSRFSEDLNGDKVIIKVDTLVLNNAH